MKRRWLIAPLTLVLLILAACQQVQNAPPIASDQNLNTPKDAPLEITLDGTDADGDPLTFTIVTGPTNGVVTGTAPTVTYTPNTDFVGGDSFTFTVNDGTVDSAEATISITVAALDPTGEEHSPGASGPVETLTFPSPDGDVTFSYEIIDGLAIHEGDMILGTEAELEELKDAIEAELFPEEGELTTQGTALYRRVCWTFLFIPVRCENYRWPNATVPYVIKSNDWDGDTAMMTQRINDAIADLHADVAVRFVPRTSEDDFVEFKEGDGCSARVGRDGGKQPINLSTGCGVSSIVHEMLHAIGLKHEHTRHDRNDSVIILRDNIRSGKGHNFDTSDIAFDVFGYDFDSIMHYGAFAFCKKDSSDVCVGPTITRLDGSTDWSRSGLSSGDIATINLLYPGEPPTISITGPSPGSSFPRRGSNVFFSTDLNDPEGMEVTVRWTSDVDGFLGTGSSLVTNDLSYGPHVVTARATDPQGNRDSDTVSLLITNTPPTVNIFQPSATTFCVNETINFAADVIDINQSGATLPDTSIEWRVGAAAPFATGPTASTSFGTAGNTTVTVRGTDELGSFDEDSVVLTIDPCTDTPPVVTITTPSGDLDEFYDGFDDTAGMWFKDIVLQGTVTDVEDDPVPAGDVMWTTDRTDIQPVLLGTGTSLTVRLFSNVCTGVTHQVTLSYTDTDGNTRSDLRRIRIFTIC